MKQKLFVTAISCIHPDGRVPLMGGITAADDLDAAYNYAMGKALSSWPASQGFQKHIVNIGEIDIGRFGYIHKEDIAKRLRRYDAQRRIKTP